MKAAPVLLAGLTSARYVLADKGYDANALRKMLRSVSIVPVIPGRRNRKRAIAYDARRYRDRHLIENAFCRINDFRRVATRRACPRVCPEGQARQKLPLRRRTRRPRRILAMIEPRP
jgi:transposase